MASARSLSEFQRAFPDEARCTSPEKIAERAKKMAAGRDRYFAELHAAGGKHYSGPPPANETLGARRRRLEVKRRRRQAKLDRLKEEKAERAWAEAAAKTKATREEKAPEPSFEELRADFERRRREALNEAALNGGLR
jgi:hypothetical protein